MSEFKLQDSVQLMHGYTPTMTISAINEETKEAYCIWYDSTKTRTIKKECVPLTALKHTPPKISSEDILQSLRR